MFETPFDEKKRQCEIKFKIVVSVTIKSERDNRGEKRLQATEK